MNLQTATTNIQNILNKLNFIERGAIESYIKQQTIITIGKAQKQLDEAAEEKEKNLMELNSTTWDKLSEALSISLMEHHISKERIDKIYSRMAELLKREAVKGLDTEKLNPVLNGVKAIKQNDFDTLLELAIETSCRDCMKGHKHCKVYQILKLYDVPKPTGDKAKCKYAYKR